MKITEEFENRIKNNEKIEIEALNAKQLLRKEISNSEYSISNINAALGINNYLYEILDAKNKKHYSRDCIIAVLIYIKSDIDSIQRILQAFGHSKIYVRIPRDQIIFEGICQQLSLWEIDDNLISHSFKALV